MSVQQEECAEGRNCVNIVEKGKERNSCRTAPRSLSRHEGRNPGSFRVSLANQTQGGSVGRPMGGRLGEQGRRKIGAD